MVFLTSTVCTSEGGNEITHMVWVEDDRTYLAAIDPKGSVGPRVTMISAANLRGGVWDRHISIPGVCERFYIHEGSEDPSVNHDDLVSGNFFKRFFAIIRKSNSFGWTVIRSNKRRGRDFLVYKRDCPADKAHFADDLAPFTHPTRDAAVAAGKAGNYAYKGI